MTQCQSWNNDCCGYRIHPQNCPVSTAWLSAALSHGMDGENVQLQQWSWGKLQQFDRKHRIRREISVAAAGCHLGAHAPATGHWRPVCCCGLSLGHHHHRQLVSVTLHSASAPTESPGRGQREKAAASHSVLCVRGQIIASLFVTVFVAHNQSGNQHNRTVEQ